jgi:polyphosphate glucokinase
MDTTALGIDIGGSGIKAALVDTANGLLLSERVRVPTPEGAHPEDVRQAINQLVESLDWQGRAGIAFPAVIQQGIIRTAANIDEAWKGLDIQKFLGSPGGCTITSVLNDADAAGMALMQQVPEARASSGSLLVVTIGTGLGTALFTAGKLVPNLELGHLEIGGIEAEVWASDAARKREDLSWEKWAKRLSTVLETLENLLWPEIIILGGGVSKKFDKFSPFLSTRALLIPSPLQNNAGIIGAAEAAIR